MANDRIRTDQIGNLYNSSRSVTPCLRLPRDCTKSAVVAHHDMRCCALQIRPSRHLRLVPLTAEVARTDALAPDRPSDPLHLHIRVSLFTVELAMDVPPPQTHTSYYLEQVERTDPSTYHELAESLSYTDLRTISGAVGFGRQEDLGILVLVVGTVLLR